MFLYTNHIQSSLLILCKINICLFILWPLLSVFPACGLHHLTCPACEKNLAKIIANRNQSSISNCLSQTVNQNCQSQILLVANCQSQVINCKSHSSVADCPSPIVNCNLLIANSSHKSSVASINCQLRMVNRKSPVIICQSPIVNDKLSVANSRNSIWKSSFI